MSGVKKANLVGGVVIVSLLCVLGYYYVRSAQSDSQAFVAYFFDGKSVAPSICPFSGKDDAGSSISGTLYLKGLKMRGDWTLAIDGVIKSAHGLSLDGKTFYSWSDTPGDVAFTTTGSAFLTDVLFIGYGPTDSACSPWFFSDDSSFNLPYGVEFRPFFR